MPSGGGSSPSGTTTTVQKSDPWSGQQPYITQGLQAAGDLFFNNPTPGTTPGGAPGAATPAASAGNGTFQGGDPNGSYYNPHTGVTMPGPQLNPNVAASSGGQPPTAISQPSASTGAGYGNGLGTGTYNPAYYPGTTYAPPTPFQNMAIAGQAQTAMDGSPLYPAAASAAQNILSPNFLSSNPGSADLQNYANGGMLHSTDAATQGAVSDAITKALPGLTDMFTGGNRLNSPGAAYAVSHGIADATAPITLAAEMAGQQNQLAAANAIGTNYNTAAGQQNSANLTAPSIQQMPYSDLSNLYNAGATAQSQGQAGINDQINRYNYNQQEPYNLLTSYLNTIQGNYGGQSTLTSPYFAQPSGGFGGALSGGLSGAASGAAIGSIIPGLGTGVGAGVGGLLGILGGFK